MPQRDFYSLLRSFHSVNSYLDNEELSRVQKVEVAQSCLVLDSFFWQVGKLALAGLEAEGRGAITRAWKKDGREQDCVCTGKDEDTYWDTFRMSICKLQRYIGYENEKGVKDKT